MPRFYCPAPLAPGLELDLPAGAARHVQVLRLQPGDTITLFNHGPQTGDVRQGGEFGATVLQMGRSNVQVRVDAHHAIERESPRRVHIAIAMPANERMDWLVEKATELGVASIQPLLSARSVLRLAGERADKKVAHWQSIAIAACEQCGGNRVPLVAPVRNLPVWLQSLAASDPTHPLTHPQQRLLLSLRETTQPLGHYASTAGEVVFLCGPEGGLSPQEEEAALAAQFAPVGLGARVLRSETAALSALAALSVA